MRSITIFVLFLGVVLVACDKGNPKMKKLMRAWRSARVENKDMDSFLVSTQRYIDTFGRNSSVETNIAVYGTANVDSLRNRIQEQFDSTRNILKESIANTIVDFRRDSMAYLSFNGTMDTSKWTLGPDDMLTLEDRNTGMNNEKIIWEIIELTDTSLVVKMKEDTSYSRVTFHPEKK